MPESEISRLHASVLASETLQLIEAKSGGFFIDATLGLGGHTELILEASAGNTVLGIDQDRDAMALAKERLERFGDRIRYFHGNFSQIAQAASGVKADGVIADLGVSSLQLDSETRGFSFRFDAPLDMRMDTSRGETAAELLQRLPEAEIANIIYQYGEERASRRIARWIVEKRESGEPVETTTELADLVRRAVRASPRDKIHPATRTFQALRIAVNNEIDILDRFISDSVDILKTEGVLAVITFHSLEDRLVKQAFNRLSGKCSCPPRIPKCVCGAEKKVAVLTKKPIVATDEEINSNPRSRSAKLRACKKL